MWRKSLIAILVLASVSISSAYIGMRVGVRYKENSLCCNMPKYHNALLSFREVLGFQSRYYSQIWQDKWVTETVFPGVIDGFFVDVGSADGITDSNTKLLEEKGWRGVCIDPFPTNMETRTCQLFKDVVFSEAGRTIEFRKAGVLGGINETLGIWKEWAQKTESVQLTTVTLTNILDRAKAPSHIQFISLDIEGAELEALRGFSFDRYTVGAFAI
jgi:FkbM family methyltransferase